MVYQFNFVEQNFDKFIDLDDEYRVLTAKNKKDLRYIVDILILADLNVSCNIHLSNKITNHDIGYVVGSTYVKFLSEYKKIDIKVAENRGKKCIEFFEFFEDFQERNKKEMEERKRAGGHPVEIKNEAERIQADLCSAFAEYYTNRILSTHQKETEQGKHFAAFKFAMALVKADLVKTMLKEFSIDWN